MANANAKVFQLEINEGGSANVLVDPSKNVFSQAGDYTGVQSNVSIVDGHIVVSFKIPVTEALENFIPSLEKGRYSTAFVIEGSSLDSLTPTEPESNEKVASIQAKRLSTSAIGFSCWPDGAGGHFCYPPLF